MNKNKYIKDVSTIMDEIKKRKIQARAYEEKAKSKFHNDLRKLESIKKEERKADLGNIELWN